MILFNWSLTASDAQEHESIILIIHIQNFQSIQLRVTPEACVDSDWKRMISSPLKFLIETSNAFVIGMTSLGSTSWWICFISFAWFYGSFLKLLLQFVTSSFCSKYLALNIWNFYLSFVDSFNTFSSNRRVFIWDNDSCYRMPSVVEMNFKSISAFVSCQLWRLCYNLRIQKFQNHSPSSRRHSKIWRYGKSLKLHNWDVYRLILFLPQIWE